MLSGLHLFSDHVFPSNAGKRFEDTGEDIFNELGIIRFLFNTRHVASPG